MRLQIVSMTKKSLGNGCSNDKIKYCSDSVGKGENLGRDFF